MTGTGRAGASIRRRLTHDQTRALLLDHGAEVIFERGLTFGMERVSLEDAVRETGVSRTSAYRIWSSDELRSPQEAYKREVLLHSIRSPSEEDIDVMTDLRDNLIAAVHTIEPELRSPETTASAVSNVVMNYVGAQQQLVLYRSLQNVFATQPDTQADPELLGMLDSAEALWRQAAIDIILSPLLDVFDLVPRFGVPRSTALNQVSVATSAFLAGMAPKAALPTAGQIIAQPVAEGTDLPLSNVCLASLVMAFFVATDA